MKRLVLDASVLIKLHIREADSARAALALRGKPTLLAPDLLWAECGNILWKYAGRGELEPNQAQALLDDMLRMPINIIPTADVIEAALGLALQYQRTVYDCVYLATAIQCEAVLLTADQRLVNALKDQPVAGHVRGL